MAYKMSALMIICLLTVAMAGGFEHGQTGSSFAGNASEDIVTSVPTGQDPMLGPDPIVSWVRFPTPALQPFAYSCIEVADINMDGYLDLITGYDNLGILIWAGDGSGSWNSFPSPYNSTFFNDLKVGDINDDGKPDIVGATNNTVYAWTGNGAGTWTDLSPAYSARPFYSLALDDINLDGKLDIVAGSKGQATNKAIWVYTGNGAGAWTRNDTNMPTSGTYYSVMTGDFNNDGKPDIVAASNGLKAWSGNGAGVWTELSAGLPPTGLYSDIDLCDFNLDGKLDLVATSSNNGGVRVWNGNGAGTWIPTLNLPMTGNYRGVEVADLSIDGYMDIVTVGTNVNETVWSGDGNDNWYPQNTGMNNSSDHKAVSTGDVNSDGKIDLCMLNLTGEIDIWASMLSRTVNTWTEYIAPATTGIANDINVFDVNLDGRLDICYAFETKGLEIWKGNGNGTWSAFASPVTTENFNSVLSVDFNKDGKPDIISTSDVGVKSWRGNGNGTWVANSPSTSNVWLGLAAADFNNDGNLDFVAGTGSNQGVRQFKGNGVGTWTPQWNLPVSGNYYGLATADMNRDGAIDIIAANGGLKVFLGNAITGTWVDSSTGLPGTSENYRMVKAADINKDGITDIIGVSGTAGVNIWLGNGAGQWNFYTNIEASNGAGLAVGDFSMNGRIDICTGSSGASVRAMKNAISSAWIDVSEGLPEMGDYSTLALADININGMLDIITFNNTAQAPRIFSGGFQKPPLQYFNIGPLNVGWNLISLPLDPMNYSLPLALVDLDGNTTWTKIKYYDANVPGWKTHRVGSLTQSLTSLTVEMGVWVYIPNIASLGDGYIRIEGKLPSWSPITLKAGWNLVGFPSLESKLASEIIPPEVNIVSIFQPNSPYIMDYVDFSNITLEPGHGYWFHADSDCLWYLW